jgi:hypothetical protein
MQAYACRRDDLICEEIMTHAPIRRSVWLLLALIGFALVNVALFLHPMSPENFLDIALSAPLQSVADIQGGNVAMFFWGSVALTVFGGVRFLIPTSALHRLFHHSKPAARLAH